MGGVTVFESVSNPEGRCARSRTGTTTTGARRARRRAPPARSLPLDGPVRGLLVDGKLSSILTTNQTFFQLEAVLDPATATLRGKFCYSYSLLFRSECVDFWARRAAA